MNPVELLWFVLRPYVPLVIAGVVAIGIVVAVAVMFGEHP